MKNIYFPSFTLAEEVLYHSFKVVQTKKYFFLLLAADRTITGHKSTKVAIKYI